MREEAWRIGLIHELAEDGDVLAPRAADRATISAGLAPVSVQLTKQMIDAGEGEGFACALEGMAGALAATTHDAREGVASFREKRAAQLQGN